MMHGPINIKFLNYFDVCTVRLAQARAHTHARTHARARTHTQHTHTQENVLYTVSTPPCSMHPHHLQPVFILLLC